MNISNTISALMLTTVMLAGPYLHAAEPVKKFKSAVKLEVRSWKGVEELVAAHKGKVVIADIWTTTCGKCKEEFPKFVAMQKQFQRDKVVFVSINCDYDGIKDKPPAFYRPEVLKFLKKHKARFENVMLDVAFIDFLDQIELASTPAVLVYGSDGKLSKRFDNDDAEKVEDEFTLDEVAGYVDKLLEE